MTQQEAADAIGVHKRAYIGWERAESGITWPNLARVAKAFDVSEDWLVGGDAVAEVPSAPEREDTRRVASLLERVIASEVEDEIELRRLRDVLAHGSDAGGATVAAQALMLQLLLEVRGQIDELHDRLDAIEAGPLAAVRRRAADLGDEAGQELTQLTRRTKAAHAAALDADVDAEETAAGSGTRDEGDATTGSPRPRARPAGTARSAARRAR